MSEIEERVAKAIAELEWGAVISPEGWCDLRVSRDGARIFELARAAIAAMPGEPAACEKCNAVLKEGDGVFTTKTGLVHFPECPASARQGMTEEQIAAASKEIATFVREVMTPWVAFHGHEDNFAKIIAKHANAEPTSAPLPHDGEKP